MANSKDLEFIARTNVDFQSRTRYFALKAATALLAKVDPTPAEMAFAKAAVESTLNIHEFCMMVLSNPTLAAMADPSSAVDNDLEFTVNSVAALYGAALL